MVVSSLYSVGTKFPYIQPLCFMTLYKKPRSRSKLGRLKNNLLSSKSIITPSSLPLTITLAVMASQWEINPTTSYADYFRQQRPAPPPDKCESVTLSYQSNSIPGNITSNVVFMETSTLSHRLNDTTTLNLTFVSQVLSRSGPVINPLKDPVYWQWNERPNHVLAKATTEQDYYAWLEWVVFRPAVHAVAAVRDQLYAAAGVPVPQKILGVINSRCLSNTVPRGTTDIISEVAERCFAAHEIKRTRVLGSDGPAGALHLVVELAQVPNGFWFRYADKGLEEKVRRLMCQVSQLD